LKLAAAAVTRRVALSRPLPSARPAAALHAQLRAAGRDLVLVTCDRRLLRAAQAEGIDPDEVLLKVLESVPEKSEERVAAERSGETVDGRLARADSHRVEVKSGAEAFQDVFDQVVFAHGDAAGQDQEVFLQALLNFMAKTFDAIGRVAEDYRFSAGVANLGG